MKPTLLTAMVLMLTISVFQAQVIYVKAGAQGDGSSWENAIGNLNDALKLAQPGMQVWVAAGTYKPTKGTDRQVSFVIPDGVAVVGGFAGHETSIEQRSIQDNPTILSGEIGQPGLADNSFNVVYMHNVGEKTVLDGFIITDGNASGNTEEATRSRCGGGLYISGTDSRPVINNCIFQKNAARDGAAVYINGRKGNCSPQFYNCVFKENEAGLDGGAIYNDGRGKGMSNPAFFGCQFYRNVGTYGGAICNATETGSCNITLEGCTFTENVAYLRGGALFSLNGSSKCYLELVECAFEGNYPDDQNMVFSNNAGRSAAYALDGSKP